eukprot:scaffold22345_cov125-Isochrysis_galbana.AAC.4
MLLRYAIAPEPKLGLWPRGQGEGARRGGEECAGKLGTIRGPMRRMYLSSARGVAPHTLHTYTWGGRAHKSVERQTSS